MAKTGHYVFLPRIRSRIEPRQVEATRFHGMRRAGYQRLVKTHLRAYLTAAVLNSKTKTRLPYRRAHILCARCIIQLRVLERL